MTSLALRYNRLLDDAFGAVESSPTVASTSLIKEPSVILSSPMPGVTDEAWTEFVRRMAVQPADAVSDSNAIGMFAMMPRRLVDLGLASRLTRTKAPSGRTIYTAAFIKPMTSKKFLASPREQYAAFKQSMKEYADKIKFGDIVKGDDVDLASALAILHRAGPRGLEKWAAGPRFEATIDLVKRVKELF